jgi:hypothetical protein
MTMTIVMTMMTRMVPMVSIFVLGTGGHDEMVHEEMDYHDR